MTTAEKLKNARGEKTREEVAKSIGVTVSALSMYERGERVPRDEVKVKLARLYNKTVQELFF